ncbi:hypothetical protein CDD80_911 [Ophiocordyceps camponoti-rufipedis]|uniref:Uncharacterized protein n=1 Tax=Ophiocordyceps camponoti-rufipedis TaxID=2004952 RepID=A0A2C5ZB89_9HYPO|nr:hypothetical protein CDD80_911 [Ophiocordyceps camponoti-rufipedis]
MTVHPTDAAAQGMDIHGLRFLNDEWNDSISNGDVFTVRWNQSLAKAGSGLGVFQVTYPKDGVVVYELVSNLTDAIEGDGASCKWTPQKLEKQGLYAMWLTSGQATQPNWTLSPPWVPKAGVGPPSPRFPPEHWSNGDKAGLQGTPWAAPFLIPVICLLGLYAVSLTGYLVYRRRKKARTEKARTNPDMILRGRNVSIDSPSTAQALRRPETGIEKQGIVGMVNTQPDMEDQAGANSLPGIGRTTQRADDDDYEYDDDDLGHRLPRHPAGRGIRIVTSSGPKSEAEERLLMTPVRSAGSAVSSTQVTPVGRNFSRPVQTQRIFA